MGTMTESSFSDRLHIFLSRPLVLLDLALYRVGLRMMIYVDDLVFVGISFDEALHVISPMLEVELVRI